MVYSAGLRFMALPAMRHRPCRFPCRSGPSRTPHRHSLVSHRQERERRMRSNPSIERTSSGKLRLPAAAAHVKRRLSKIFSFRCTLVLLIAVGSSGCILVTTNSVPDPSAVAAITLSIEPDHCCIDRYRITDRSSIERILVEYSLLKDGWRTEQYLAL